MERLGVADAQPLWQTAGAYLNTASYGLPPTPSWDALQAALEDWRGGRTSWEHWGIPGEEGRASFARLVGVPVGSVAIAADLDAIAEAAREHDVMTVVDATQAVGLGLESGDSAIVFCDAEGAAEKLERAGIRAAVRGGRLRTSWHVYNTTHDVDQTLDVLLG